jgi:hypothetical protein
MAIYETFSKRQKKLASQGKSDPYRYDIFPQPLRVQIKNLLVQSLGESYQRGHLDSNVVRRWVGIHETLSHEYGVSELAEGVTAQAKCLNFFLECQKTEECLDFVELCLIWIKQLVQLYLGWGGSYKAQSKQCEQAISEVNYRLREHGVGYQFENGKLIRVDSQFIHAEVVKPALLLLHDAGFAGPSEEFLQAHEHYRAKRYPEAIAGALKAFESSMKGICNVRQWEYPEGATAKVLIDLIFSKQLLPSSLSSQFSGLRSVLESGLPTVRNKQGGHGQGKDPVTIPSHIAAYALHLAASNIVMLVEAHKALK